jgi:hypothetical protein
MWDHRNDIKHNNTTPKQKKLLIQLWLQVEHQFVLGTLGLPVTDHYLLKDKDNIVTYDLHHTQRWLRLITGAREEQLQVEATLKNQFARARISMRQWLMKANPPERIKFLKYNVIKERKASLYRVLWEATISQKYRGMKSK